MIDFDVGGFLTSTEFIAQLASFIAAILSAIASGIVGNIFSQS